MSILAKVRSDILAVVSKLSVFRQKGDMRNYRTLSDSLSILSGMHRKHLLSSGLDKCAESFYNTLHVKLTDEIVLISKGMDESIDNDDARLYRDMLISLDKLANVKQNLELDFCRSAERMKTLKQYRD